MPVDYLIIGNSAGGIGAVEAIREIDSTGSIMVVSGESYPVYSRPLISEYVAGERDLNGIMYRPPDFYERMGIEVVFGKNAVSLNTAEKAVELEDRQKVAYGKLLLATGGSPIIPPMAGHEKTGIFNFTTLDDARGIAETVQAGARTAVVIGGGLIGLSVTDALRKLGLEVTIVELMDRILGAVLDEQAALMERAVLEGEGVQFRTGRTVKEITGSETDDTRTGGVILDNGERIDCDLVVIAIGVVPRIDLARGTDIQINRGILVDRHMETSAPGVYACGDVAESYDYIYECDRVVPIWPNAHIGGRIAGYNMAGKEALYGGGTAMNSLKYFGLPVVSAGMVNPASDSGCEVIASQDDGRYQRFVVQNNRLVGMVMVKDIARAGIYYGLMRDQVNLDGLKGSLLSEEFGLISLPEDILRKRLEVPDLCRLHVFHEVEKIEEPVTEG